jgi:hypothetical protein
MRTSKLGNESMRGIVPQPDAGRRAFLRRAGITAAVAAAFAGVADVVGLSAASGAVRESSARHIDLRGEKTGVPDGTSSCTYVRCGCPQSDHGCCYPGYCCYHCTGTCFTGPVCFARSITHCSPHQTFYC